MSLNRRAFLAATALAVTVPGVVRAAESKMEKFSDDSYNAAIASGEPFMVAVLSSW